MVKLSFLMLLPLLLVLSSAQNSPQDVGYDRSGGDLPGMPILLGPSGTAQRCDALCVERRTCSSWAYDTCSSTGRCWLKNTDRPLTPSSCITSAFVRHVEVPLRIEYGVDRSGGDLPGMPIRLDCGADALTCEDMCYVRADCVAWAASTCGSRQCWLKQQVPAASTASCRVSGVKL